MKTNDQDIRNNVALIATYLLKDKKLKDEEKPIVRATIDLITNLLVNINDIAGK